MKSKKDEFNCKVKNAQCLKEKIRSYVEQGDIDTAEAYIEEYKKLFSDDIEIISIEFIIFFIRGDMNAAEQHILAGLRKVPYNFDLNYNLGYLYKNDKKYHEAVFAFLTAKKVATNDEEKLLIDDEINKLMQFHINIDLSSQQFINQKLFPLKTINTSWIGDVLFKNQSGEGYIPLYYNEPLIEPPLNLWNCFKTETLIGKKYHREEVIINDLTKAVIPLAVNENNAAITMTMDKKKYRFDDFLPNRYYYMPAKDRIKIKSDNSFIVGKPLSLVQKKEHTIKFSLCILIDALSQPLIDKYTLKKLMPNTDKFFSCGAIFNNCYGNADWTFPSIGSIFSGKYQTNHKIFHPELAHFIGERGQTLGEFFNNDDYITFQSCGNWRKTPSHGYVKGFDRTIYQSATVGSTAEEVINSFFEQSRAFKGRDQFAFLSFFELHKVNDNICPQISNQIRTSIDSRISKRDNKKSVDKDFDERKVERYINEMNRLDYYLKMVYDYIEDNYDNSEIMVTLCSDHGESYLDNETHLLRDCITKVPFFIRGGDIPSMISNELIENVDILPTILTKCFIKFEAEQFDGAIPKILGGKKEKDYAYSESIYPGKTYKAVIRDNVHTLIFESEGIVQNDGRFSLGDFSIILENNVTKADETNNNIEKVSSYFEIIIKHISSFLMI